ncbi:MAG: radical SAM protein, partial [Thermodesulfovibrionales bacterium]|nr:radical SAM protein [Thermodesulfovibrionales bacterium]
MQQSLYYEGRENKLVVCLLCPHRCVIAPDKTGKCSVRKNIDGVLYSLNYGKVVATNIDPIEKKPLFHFYPDSKSFSIAAVGCNFKCLHCQKHHISQASSLDIDSISTEISPSKIVQMALFYNCISISYTYTEPTVYFEYALECAKIAYLSLIHI